MTNATKRRWSFSLRTMFILIAVVGIPLGWIGWNVEVVRQRRAMALEIAAEDSARAKVLRRIELVWNRPLAMNCAEVQGATTEQLSFVRRLLGDELKASILRNTEADATRARALFPEAEISYYLGYIDTLLPPEIGVVVDEAFGFQNLRRQSDNPTKDSPSP